MWEKLHLRIKISDFTLTTKPYSQKMNHYYNKKKQIPFFDLIEEAEEIWQKRRLDEEKQGLLYVVFEFSC